MQTDTLNKNELQAGISLAMVYVLRMLGLFMVIPVLAVVAVTYPDYTPLWLGLAVGGYGLTQALLQIPMGILSDKIGRKPVIYLGLSLFAVGSLIAGMADTMWMMTIGRILQGSGAIAGAIMALATDVTRESQRTKVMAIIGISIGFSFYLALLLGPVIASHLGLQGIFLITAGFSLLCIPLVKFGIQNPIHMQASGDALPQVSQLTSLFKHQHLWRLNLSVLVIHLLITSFFVQVPTMLINIGVGLEAHWLVYTIILFASILGLVLLIKLANTLKVTTSFRLALLLMAAGFLILASQAPSYINIIVAGILFFAGFNFLEAKMPAMVSSIAPAGRKGSAMGIYASHQFFGAFLGGLLSGVLNTYFDTQYTFIMCLAAILLLCMLAKSFASSEKIKRLSLSLNDYSAVCDEKTLKLKCAQVNKLQGVKEALVDKEAQVIYLKVDAKQFDTSKVEAILRA